MVVKRRQLVIATLIIALGSAVFINWYYTRPQSDITAQNQSGKESMYTESAENLGEAVLVNKNSYNKDYYFEQVKKKRREAHDETMEMLDKVIDDDNSSEQASSEASEEKIRLAVLIKAEADAEALITAKTGGECIVTLNNNTAQVVMEKGKLNETVAMQIKEIIISQADVSETNISITELTV